MARMTKEQFKIFLEGILTDIEESQKNKEPDKEIIEQIESDINYFINYNLK
jgi:hypothetical protein